MGHLAEVELLASLMRAPPAGAGPFSVTKPADGEPPVTDVGVRVRDVRTGGFTVSVAVRVAEPRVAVIVAVSWALVALVVTVNAALVEPAETVTELGTITVARLLLSLTTVPPLPEGPVRVTVPEALVPPATALGVIVTESRVTVTIVSVALWVCPPRAAEIDAVWGLVTFTVPIANVAEDWLAATVTDAGTVAVEALLLRVTTAPDGPAFPLRVTVPIAGLPPVTVDGFSAKFDNEAGVIVNIPDWVVPMTVPEIETLVVEPTPLVVMVKLAEVCPAGTVTEDSVDAAGPLEDSATDVPPAPAGPASVTVPVEGVPPTTEEGLSVSDRMPAGLIVRVADRNWPFRAPVIVAEVGVLTPPAVTVNVADVWPAGTRMKPGVGAAALLLVRTTLAPPGPAGVDIFTVQVETPPLDTAVGLRLIEAIVGSMIVRVAERVTPASEPEMLAEVMEATGVVKIANVAKFWPAATLMVAGTVAAVWLLEIETTMPAEPAGPLRVTVPVDELPPWTLAGLSVSDDREGALMVNVADAEEPDNVALIVVVAASLTGVVVTVTVPELCPAAIVTLDGTIAAELEELKATVIPPGPAGPLSCTVAFDEDPPTTAAGFNVTETTAAG